MAKTDPISIDKTELILFASVGSGIETINVAYDKIIRIEFRKCEEAKMFKKFPSEQIIFTIRGREDPVIFFKSKVGEDLFDSYKNSLAKFAKDNRVSFASNL
jgi:hypothetical protein